MARPYSSFARLQDGVYRFTRGPNGGSSGGGMRVTIAGGVHGNERIGVKVLDRLRLALLRAAPLPADLVGRAVGAEEPGKAGPAFPVVARGASLTLMYGNPRAIRVGTRGSAPHRDLNRCFPVDVLTRGVEASSYEEQRALELAPLLAASDLLLDLHSTNKPSAPFVRIAGYPNASGGIPAPLSSIASRLPCDIVLHDPRHLIGDGRVALTDEFVGASGGMGVCFESGLASDLSDAKVDAITRGILEILTRETHCVDLVDAADPSDRASRMDAVDIDAVDANAPSQRKRYEVTEVFKLSDRGFQWADDVGESNFQCVPAGQPIGFVGAEREPFAVAYDAYIVFPKVPSLWKLGAPLGWLCRRVSV